MVAIGPPAQRKCKRYPCRQTTACSHRPHPISPALDTHVNPTTIGELLHWSYANLAMAHAAVTANAPAYGRPHFMARARLSKGLQTRTLSIGPLADDERLKLLLPQACCYCASTEHLTVDHLMPTHLGGANIGDNLVWACRACNSSKGARNALEWMAKRGEFAPQLLLRRYLKLAVETCLPRGLLDTPLSQAPALPFSLSAIPRTFPQPSQLRLWVVDMARTPS